VSQAAADKSAVRYVRTAPFCLKLPFGCDPGTLTAGTDLPHDFKVTNNDQALWQEVGSACNRGTQSKTQLALKFLHNFTPQGKRSHGFRIQ